MPIMPEIKICKCIRFISNRIVCDTGSKLWEKNKIVCSIKSYPTLTVSSLAASSMSLAVCELFLLRAGLVVGLSADWPLTPIKTKVKKVVKLTVMMSLLFWHHLTKHCSTFAGPSCKPTRNGSWKNTAECMTNVNQFFGTWYFLVISLPYQSLFIAIFIIPLEQVILHNTSPLPVSLSNQERKSVTMVALTAGLNIELFGKLNGMFGIGFVF